MTDLLKVSAVSFLNARPLIYDLGQSDGLAIHLCPPAECAQRVSDGQADVGLIPVIEYSRIREKADLEIIPGISISSPGYVKSVELFFNKGMETISRVAVDSKSRTSVALLQIILGEKYDIRPEFIPMEANLDSMLSKADAALIIGDLALELEPQADNKLDLGEEWKDLTDGLPFVYAVWAARRNVCRPKYVTAFHRAKEKGLAAIPEIAAQYHEDKKSSLSPSFYQDYLTENIRYDLGLLEQEAMMEYFSYCFYYGIIQEIPDLHLVGDAPLS